MKRGAWSDVYTTPPPPEFLCGSDGIQNGMTRVGPKSAIFGTIDLRGRYFLGTPICLKKYPNVLFLALLWHSTLNITQK